ncbi:MULTISPECIES: LPP20 family lipoprotein [unclassified Campylobacter]|uniref:LPP20 family lipoprotein n=1 Tax=unclassified Campylobacter TaxID=2593542 RepID=UPI002015FD5C|nr:MULTISPECIES: LPP20 family lipoprotein [unclassified Campylobacter]
MLNKIFMILTLFGLVLNVQAEIVSKTVTKTEIGEGSGITREEAINNAIIEAIGKMNGVSINSIKNSQTFAISDNSGSKITDSYSEQINKATKGRADSYEVLSVDQDMQDRYFATVEIKKTTTTKKYKVPGLSADSRRSVVVFDKSSIEYESIGNLIHKRITAKLLESRKFNLLDRQNEGYYELEKSFIRDGDAHKDEKYKLGRALATDYILLFEIRGMDATTKTSNLTGKVSNAIETVIDYEVLLFATRQIKFSNTLGFKTSQKEKGLIAENAVIDEIATNIAKDIVNAIYPLKVADASASEVVFTQKLSVGEVYECFSLGKALKDAYTKETTGRVEKRVGSVEVSRVTPKISYATIKDGKISIGDICRPFSNDSIGLDQGRESNYELNQGGGVKLGF